MESRVTGWLSRCFTPIPVLGCCELLGLCPEPRDGFAGPGETSWGSVTADSQPGWLQQMGMGRIWGEHRGRCW